MNESNHEALDEAQQRAQDAVRALPEPEARADFRARLRDQFVEGSIETTLPELETLAASRPAHGPNVVPLHRVRPWARYAVPLAVAASLLLMVSMLNRGPGWSVTSASGEFVEVDGVRVSCDELTPLQAVLHPGCEVTIPEGGKLEFASEGTLFLQLNGGLRATLPNSPGRWFGREVNSSVSGEGTLRVVTAAGFEGATYRVQAGGAELVVRGTAFTVICDEDLVCICVLDGEVEARMPDGSREQIPAGGRVTLVGSGTQVHRGDMLPTEREALESLRDRLSQEI